MFKACLDTGLWLGYCAFIFWLSAQPRLPAPMLFPAQDKLAHLAAYALLALLSWRCFAHSVRLRLRLGLFAFAFASIYGVTDELHQAFVPGRNAGVWDWVADSIGAAACVWLLKRWRQRWPMGV